MYIDNCIFLQQAENHDTKEHFMGWPDWEIVIIPLLIVWLIGLKSRQYVKSAADVPAAGRVAGRYVPGAAVGGTIDLHRLFKKKRMNKCPD